MAEQNGFDGVKTISNDSIPAGKSGIYHITGNGWSNLPYKQTWGILSVFRTKYYKCQMYINCFTNEYLKGDVWIRSTVDDFTEGNSDWRRIDNFGYNSLSGLRDGIANVQEIDIYNNVQDRDLNNICNKGFFFGYLSSTAAWGTKNQPHPYQGLLISIFRASDTGIQITAHYGGEYYIRIKFDKTWYPWHQL